MATTTELLTQVRTLIGDLDPANQVLTDGQLSTFLDLNDSNARLAAADALDTIATSEALVSKVIRTQDLQTDGAKVADALRKHADRLRATAAAAVEDVVFDVIYPTNGCVPELTEHAIVWGL